MEAVCPAMGLPETGPKNHFRFFGPSPVAAATDDPYRHSMQRLKSRFGNFRKIGSCDGWHQVIGAVPSSGVSEAPNPGVGPTRCGNPASSFARPP